MRMFVNLCKRLAPAALLLLALLLALPITVGADAEVFASVRVYEGVDPADQGEIARLTAAGFLPIMRESDGFIAYFLLPDGDTLATISAFETAEQAAASNDAARDFVVENLAPLLPNPPTIVQGPMDTAYFALLDEMMMVDNVASLYASLRVYDGVDLTQRAETTALVHSIFLPKQQEAQGFWGYVRLHDSVSHSVALSIFDSEANALAANDLAAAFVAEYLTDRPDQEPLRVNGQLGVAALADVHMGENLIAVDYEDEVFASIRIYDGIDPADQAEVTRLTREGFLPINRGSGGFVGYYLLPAGDMLASVNLFDSPEQAAASNEKARDFVAEYLAPLLPNAPTIVEGHIDVMYVNDADDMMLDASNSGLYASLRIYPASDMGMLAASVEAVKAYLLPALHEAGGLFSYYALNDGDDTIAGLNVYVSEEKALAANDIAAAFNAEHTADFLPDDPLRVNGQLGVAALADVHMGENLIADEYEDEVFASIRIYDGIDPADQAEITRLTREGFLPINRGSDGFVGYYLLPAGDMLASVNLFDSPEQAAASNEKARDFVAEYLAPLLPNPPMIVEGTVDVCARLMVNAVDPGDLSMPLHARLVIYDGFDMARLDESVGLVDSVFLPKLRDAGGLFSYYCISDGVGKAVALRVMDSAESLRRGTDIAAEFIADYMAGWLPEDPLVLEGQLGVAAVGSILQGENLAESGAEASSVFASVRVYNGIDPASQDEIARVTEEGFLPIMRESDGFVGYYFLTAVDMLATVSLFDSPEQASASADKARDYVAEHLAPLLPNAPTVYEGELAINDVAALGEGELYASIRLYAGFDLIHFDEANDLAIAHLLPGMQALDGYFSQYRA